MSSLAGGQVHLCVQGREARQPQHSGRWPQRPCPMVGRAASVLLPLGQHLLIVLGCAAKPTCASVSSPGGSQAAHPVLFQDSRRHACVRVPWWGCLLHGFLSSRCQVNPTLHLSTPAPVTACPLTAPDCLTRSATRALGSRESSTCLCLRWWDKLPCPSPRGPSSQVAPLPHGLPRAAHIWPDV